MRSVKKAEGPPISSRAEYRSKESAAQGASVGLSRMQMIRAAKRKRDEMGAKEFARSGWREQLEFLGAAPEAAPSFLVDVTPALAEIWLANNKGNRKPSAGKIRRFAAMMADGAWDLNGESLKFSVNGRLLDGQSRLTAVCQAGVSVRMELRFGLPERTQETMDSGELRSIGHSLQMRGEKNHLQLAAALRMLHLYRHGALFPSSLQKGTTRPGLYFGARQALALLEEHRGIERCIVDAQGGVLRHWITPSKLGCLFYIFAMSNRLAYQEFRDGFRSGSGLAAGSPILALRTRLEIAGGEEDKLPIQTKLILAVKAWNLFRAGENVQVLRVVKGERFPDVTGCRLKKGGEG